MSLATPAPFRCSRSSNRFHEAPWGRASVAHTGRAVATATIVLATLVAYGEPDPEAKTYTWLTFEEISRRDFRPGERIEVIGRYMELRDNEVVLFRSTASFMVEDPRILREIFTLSALESQLVLRAVCVDPGGKKPTFLVEKATAGSDATTAFEKEIVKLRQVGPRGIEPLFELARRIQATAVEFQKHELLPLIRAAAVAGLELQEKQFAPDDLRSRLDLVRKLHEIMSDRRFTMQLLVALEEKFPGANEVREFLIKIGCRRFRDRWMTYADFKRLQGFVKFGNHWLLPEEKEFLEIVETVSRLDSNPILRRMMHREYELLTKRGEVAVGMKREEVYDALGFPDRVYRRRFRGKVFDQWVYGNRYYYFLDGLLLKYPQDRD